MKKLTELISKGFLIAALPLIFAGCDFLSSSTDSYADNSIDVSAGGTYNIPEEYQDYDAYLIEYNSIDVALTPFSGDGWSVSASYGPSYSKKTASRNAVVSTSENNDFKNDSINDNYLEEKLKIRHVPFVTPEIELQPAEAGSRTLAGQKTYTSTVGEKVNFNLGSGYVSDRETKEATLMALGKYCKVWHCTNETTEIPVNNQLFEDLAEKFDAIFKLETSLLCSNVPEIKFENIISVSSSDKFNLVVYDIDEDAWDTGKSGYVEGFVNAGDMIISSYSNYDKSNECQVAYLDTYFLAKRNSSDGSLILDENDKAQLRGDMILTLVHEFQHLLMFIEKDLNYNSYRSSSEDYETWFTEMMSMLTEDMFVDYLGLNDLTDSPKWRLYGGGLDSSNTCYMYNTNKGFDTWNTSDVLPCYANAYAFGAYLVRNYGGINMLKELFRNVDVNESSVVNAVNQMGYNYSFDEILSLWAQTSIFFDTKDHVSLKKSFSGSIKGTTLNASAIDLRCLSAASSKTASAITGLKATGSYSNNYETKNGYTCWYGPIYWNSFDTYTTINPTGYEIYYLGQISEFTMTNNAGLSYRIVFKDE